MSMHGLGIWGLLTWIVAAQAADKAPPGGWQPNPKLIEKLAQRKLSWSFREENVPKYRLPDPLQRPDGGRIKTPEEWEQGLRPATLELFRRHVYGRPPLLTGIEFFVADREAVMDGRAMRKIIRIVCKQNDKSFQFQASLLVPRDKARAPVFLLINHRSASSAEAGRVEKDDFWPAEQLLARGFAAAVFHANLVDRDKPEPAARAGGVRSVFTSTGTVGGDNWGTIAAWAWGASRVLDYLETDPDVDPTKVAVLGHSRGGKTALWAGAQDQRFALVISNNSGCGGAALSRRRFGETVAAINDRFPHWFCDNFKTFNGREDELPIDQHQLLALVAPRGLYVTSSDGDFWADQRGEFLALVQAAPVFALYGSRVVRPEEMPALDQPLVRLPMGYHIRTGEHALTEFDWQRFMDFADRLYAAGRSAGAGGGAAGTPDATAANASGPAAPLPRLKISDNRRFLVTDQGKPFFYLGDTAWELFHRLNRPEVDFYLANRAQKGFTVIQAVALAEVDGHTVPNAYGHVPLHDLDPARPAVKDGPDDDYWDHVDYVVHKANSLGLYIGLLPTWGRYWHDAVHQGKPLFTAANAERYGRWLGERYRDAGVIWILGGDRRIENDAQRAVIAALARGIGAGDGGLHLITFHPPGAAGSAQWFHAEPWLDFNMRQNGHAAEFTGRYDATKTDYDRTPIKPVLDGEPIYEDHPVSFRAKELGHSIAADVRRPFYWDVFSGACGHTYGHHSVWQFWQPGRNPINNPLLSWRDALEQPGAAQMQHGRRLIESRPFLARIPDDSIIVTDRVPTSVPGAGRARFVATRDIEGTYAMVYAPVGRPFSVRLGVIQAAKVKAWWFNPRTGAAEPIGAFPNQKVRTFVPPDKGEALDWVLVLDDAAKGYGPPGR